MSIRLKPNIYDTHAKSIYYYVEIANSNNAPVSLADQNYRFFYNSKSLKFNENESMMDLPQDLYSKMKVVESQSGISLQKPITELGLTENDQMGFANLFIQLLDTKEAGTTISPKDGWVRVAILRFDIVDETLGSLIVWGENGNTNGIATAFVELMEWVSPNKTKAIAIEHFEGGQYLGRVTNNSEYRIHPNPANERVHLILDDSEKSLLFFKLYNVTGQEVRNVAINSGTSELSIVTGDLPNGYYTVQITDNNHVVHHDQLIVAH